MSDGVSIREYARMRGDMTEAAVRKAIKTGRIVAGYVKGEGSRGKIIPEVADREMAANTHAFSGWNGQARNIQQDTSDRVTGTFAQSRAIREAYQARLAKLEFEERSAELVRKTDVEREAFALARLTRDAMLAIPDRLAAELAGISDPFVIHQKITAEIRGAIAEVSKRIEP